MNRTRNLPRLALAIAAFAAFTAYSTWVVVTHGYFGFIGGVALASDWGLQVFLDLVIALVFVSGWMVRDARRRGIPVWPYLLGVLTLGSIGALAYLVHREATLPALQTHPA